MARLQNNHKKHHMAALDLSWNGKLPADAPLFVFNLDDTIAVGGKMSEQTQQCLRDLRHTGAGLAVASFNSEAIDILQRHDMEMFFDAIVCGGGAKLRKSRHISKIFELLEWEPRPNGPGFFLFDDVANLQDVVLKYHECFPLVVDSIDNLRNTIDTAVAAENARLARLSATPHDAGTFLAWISSPVPDPEFENRRLAKKLAPPSSECTFDTIIDIPQLGAVDSKPIHSPKSPFSPSPELSQASTPAHTLPARVLNISRTVSRLIDMI